MRRVGFAVALVVIAACGGVDGSAETTTTEKSIPTTTVPADTTTTVTLPDLGAVLPLRSIDGWLQSDVDSLDDLRGKVVVIQFWTFGCHNCKATLGNLQDLYAKHEDDEFEIVGIHSPEFDYEKDPDAILEAAESLGVTWPIALDTEKRSFFFWQGSPAYWPRTYVVDRDGHIRFDHIGEGKYEELNATVATLLG
jgi:thiol-disulfide isomerase/thioredoxin